MNQKELKELIEFLIEKDIAEFELERGDVKVKIKRAGEHTVVHAQADPRYYAVPSALAPGGCRWTGFRLRPSRSRMLRRHPKRDCTR